MSHRPSNQPIRTIPILLLKTRSQPHDAYEEYLSNFNPPTADSDIASVTSAGRVQFQPQCIPVLEHRQNEETLATLRTLLKDRRLKERYGGMIFTSQRAVEAWADTVGKVENSEVVESDPNNTNFTTSHNTAQDSRSGGQFETDVLISTPFPLYVVGPATARALTTLISDLPARSPFLSTRPSIHGAETGSGSTLAPYILQHYNGLHAERWFTWHDAPRLPFIPLLGMGSENYSRRRLEPDDPRLQKTPLLFLVGEQRRDIIPKTLMDKALDEDKIPVEEVEVYRTEVRSTFRADFDETIKTLTSDTSTDIIVVVVFSPQGSSDMLHALDLLNHTAQKRWTTPTSGPKFVIATIGPTTRDYLADTCGFKPDVCAAKPTPEAVREGVLAFLAAKGLL